MTARNALRWLLVAAMALVLAGCASRPTHPDAFAFGVMGDTQYNAAEEAAFLEMMRQVDAEDLAFVVHVGDFMGGVECSDELFQRRKREYDASAHPFVYVPGDNEWVDCRQPRRGKKDPIERLAKLRELFFADNQTLGRKRMETLPMTRCLEGHAGCRCPALPENRIWVRAGVRFVTLNVPGSENNMGFDRDNDEEARCRMEANAVWLEQALRMAEQPEARALVIIIHANPWDGKRGDSFRPFVRRVADAARRVSKPILFVHGDSHNQRIDTPFADSLEGPLTSITRLETFGSPLIGWIKVIVDPDDPQVFRFEPRLFRVVVPK